MIGSSWRYLFVSLIGFTLACQNQSGGTGASGTSGSPGTPSGSSAASTTQPAGGTGETTQPSADAPPRVELLVGLPSEDWGRIVIELNPEKAPITVKNFLQYVDEGYYNGTIFHRVLPNFMIQGGGFTAIGSEKRAGLHAEIQNEAKNGLRNARGTIAMARTGRPHSATSQFFINVVDNAKLDHPSFDGWGYAAFGKVVEGMDVVDRIKNVETRANPDMPDEKSQPVNPPLIKAAKRVK